MIYHFNQVNNDIDTASYIHHDEQRSLCRTTHSSINEEKRSVALSFSEKYVSVKTANKSILEIVFPRKTTSRFFVFIIIFVSFLYLGAAIFGAIELHKEKTDRKDFQSVRKLFLKNHSCVSEKDLENFIIQIETLTNRGISPKANATTYNYNWDFPNSVFFVTTLVTTIGYGNDKPVTIYGKIFCIIFVIIGVPLMMVMTSAVVERLFAFVDLIFSAIFYKLKWNITEVKFRRIQIVVCFSILTVFFILIPAWIFSSTEESKWTYLDSIYYCIISLTTIGLGDYVPGSQHDIIERDLSKILSTVYLFVGLIFASFTIRIFHKYKNWNFMGRLIYLNADSSPLHDDLPIVISYSDYAGYNNQYPNPEGDHIVDNDLPIDDQKDLNITQVNPFVTQLSVQLDSSNRNRRSLSIT